MNMTDRRVIRTRKALGESLLSLTLAHGYEDLTVKDITRYAQVGYATFYRHFKSKDELLRHIMLSLIDEIRSEMASAKNVYQEAVCVFSDIRKRRSAYQVFLSLPRDNRVRKTVWLEIAKFVTERYGPIDGSTVPYEVAVNHVIETFLELIRWYLKHDDEYSPEDLAAIHMELIVRASKHVTLEPREARQNVTST